ITISTDPTTALRNCYRQSRAERRRRSEKLRHDDEGQVSKYRGKIVSQKIQQRNPWSGEYRGARRRADVVERGQKLRLSVYVEDGRGRITPEWACYCDATDRIWIQKKSASLRPEIPDTNSDI